MYQRLTAFCKLGCVFASFLPVACLAGQRSQANPYVITGDSITKSSASAGDLVFPTAELKPEYLKAIKLSMPMMQTLNKYSPKFVLWSISDYPAGQLKGYPYSEKSLPYTVKGDFNGDGIEDAAIAGHNQESNLVLVLISSGNADYQVLTAKEDKYYTDVFKAGPPAATDALVLKKKGTKTIEGDISATVTILKTDGFGGKGIRTFDRAAHKFKQACTGMNTYEYTGKFTVSYLGLVAESATATSVQHPFKNILLTDEISAALRVYDKDFVIWKLEDYPREKIISYPYTEKSSPYSVSDDFNNDGKEDMVFSGHDNDANITVALISSPSSYSPLEIARFPCYKLFRKHKKDLPFTPTDVLAQHEKGKFLVRQINTWALEDPTDDYSDDYKLTGLNGQTILYKYVEKFFKHDGPENECVDKGDGTPW